jgi:hypothetical protein
MRYRATKPADLRIARDFLPGAYKYSAQMLEDLPRLWETMLHEGRLNSMVVEGADGSVLGVGLSVFVADDFAARQIATPRPYLSARLHEMIAAGRSPVLDRREIARANGGAGLSLMPLHFSTASFDMSDPEIVRIVLAAQDTFRFVHAGYRVRLVLKEVVGIGLCRYMVSSGLKLHCDYAGNRDVAALHEDERPYMLAAGHAEFPVGSTLSMMFAPPILRFRFSPAEQRLLRAALLLESDEAAAAELNLSRDTLRKHWSSIYERVRGVDPQFFPDEGDQQADNGVRGRGKRRHLLQYLQLYMEELRPYPRARQAAPQWHSPQRRRAAANAVA